MQVLRALAREALERLELLDAQAEEVAALTDQATLEQLLEYLPAGAVDVHRATADEMLELLPHSSRAGQVRAVVTNGLGIAHDRRAAHGTDGGHLELALAAVAPLDERSDDLGNDVARLVQDDVIADEHVLAAHLVEVVQCRPGDGRAGNLGRGQVRDGRQRSGAPDVGHDVLDEALDLLWRVLERDRPARRVGDHAQSALEVEAVDLDHHAVSAVRQVVARLVPALDEADHAVDIEARLTMWLDGQPKRLHVLQCSRLGVGRALLDEHVEPRREAPARGDLRIDLAQRARAAVARIGVQRQPGFLALGVDARKLGLGHVDLAAGLDRDRLGQTPGH